MASLSLSLSLSLSWVTDRNIGECRWIFCSEEAAIQVCDILF